MKFKNLTFTTAAHSDSPDDNDTIDENDDATDNEIDVPDSDADVPDDGTDVPDNDTDVPDNETDAPVIDPSSIAAGFEAIRNNPHYDATHFSRTLWQVD